MAESASDFGGQVRWVVAAEGRCGEVTPLQVFRPETLNMRDVVAVVREDRQARANLRKGGRSCPNPVGYSFTRTTVDELGAISS